VDSVTQSETLTNEELIEKALKTAPRNNFAIGCKNFLHDNGFLSKKQRYFLALVSRPWPKRERRRGRRRYHWAEGLDYGDEYSDYSGFSGNLNGDY